ncbi:hypothetical protein L596_018501 [Steinernema carpocapsae]|uniref:Major facilitator superfamily (MFS) profile domain-containing protein n=1 Tax=Steinernema carpocapsae TaxID=34508 RepID=A0A4U5N5W0_STECR|nr:hypothetical protein L596_018501 [Steinernema carpocapsae]
MRSGPPSTHSTSDFSSSLRSIEREEKLTAWLVFSVFAVTIGSSFQFGFHMGCINVPSKHITEWISTSHSATFGQELSQTARDVIWSATVSLFAVGGMIGGLLSGYFADGSGRKRTILVLNFVVGAATLAMTLSKVLKLYPLLMLGRFLIGFDAGVVAGVVPMYVTELSPKRFRGALGSVHQLMITVAILLSQIIGIPALLGNKHLWEYIFLISIGPMIIQLATLPFCPESPKYNIINRSKDDSAERDLRKLRGEEDVLEEVEEVFKEADLSASGAKSTGILAMFQGFLRWPTVVVIVLMMAQQLSGINAAMFYSTRIFEATLHEKAVYATIGMGAINVVQTTVSLYLIEKFGRRPLLLVGFTGMTLSSLGIFGSLMITNVDIVWPSYLAVAFLLIFVVAFATGPGSIPFLYATEIFGSSERASASAIVAFTNWFFAFVVGIAFLPLNTAMGPFVFIIFTVICGLATTLTFFFLPETKNKSLKEIEYAMEDRKPCFIEKKILFHGERLSQ